MDELQRYPGTPQHQAVLHAVVEHYHDDPRILAVCVFGSLGRGNWDRYSDLDLDIVVADDVTIRIEDELRGLCDALGAVGERAALVIPDGEDEGDVVLESLLEFSIRYHPLRATHPNIVDTLMVLAGRLDAETIMAAGLANPRAARQSPDRLVDRAVRYAVEVDVAIKRKRFWMGVELLHRMRGLVMELYVESHGGVRALQFFDTNADAQLQAALRAALPAYDLASLQSALAQLLDFLENDFKQLTNSRVRLTMAQRQVLQSVRRRQIVAD